MEDDMSLTKEGAMSMVEFIKNLRKEMPELEFRVTDNEGRVYKSTGWKDDKIEKNIARHRKG
jgi:hypothetical protein